MKPPDDKTASRDLSNVVSFEDAVQNRKGTEPPGLAAKWSDGTELTSDEMDGIIADVKRSFQAREDDREEMQRLAKMLSESLAKHPV